MMSRAGSGLCVDKQKDLEINMINREEQYLIGHLKDLAKRSYDRGIYTFSEFLGVSEQGVLDAHRDEFGHVGYSLYGGHELSERCIVCFGKEEQFGYAPTYPVSVVAIRPLAKKFSESLTHRDYLGSLMNLGIKRETLGDIRIVGHDAYVFCLDEVCDFICSELTRVRHTQVRGEVVDGGIPELAVTLQEESYPVSSLRIDVVVAALCRKSRKESLAFFEKGEVILNGHVVIKNADILKPGDIFSVRGQGKFRLEGTGGTSKRGRIYIRVMRYI